jgi:hypothetical protein
MTMMCYDDFIDGVMVIHLQDSKALLPHLKAHPNHHPMQRRPSANGEPRYLWRRAGLGLSVTKRG